MRLLAVRQDNNGDVLLAGPAIRALAAHGEVTLVCGPSGAAAAAGLPGVAKSIVFEAAWIEAEPRPFDVGATRAFVSTIGAERIDSALIFTSFHQSPLPMALLLRLAGVPRICAISVDYGGGLLDVRHQIDDDRHEVERALSLTQAAGFPLPSTDDARLAMTIAPDNGLVPFYPYVVVHPGATVRARAWAPAANRTLVRELRARGTNVVVTGSVAERALCAYVAGDDALDLAGQTDFAMLGRVIADADAIVVGNTGAAHVAAAVGTPVVSIFAPTIPATRFRPWRVAHELLGDQAIPCAGCRARICPRPEQSCVADITPRDVQHALDRLRAAPVLCAS